MSGSLASASVAALPAEPVALAHAVIGYHGKSFALASKLLPAALRDEAVVLYAWCRRVDDAVDTESVAEQPRALHQLRAELDEVYGRATPRDPLLAALQQLVRARGIPRHYPDELLSGMAMDVGAARYDTLDELLGYSYRVASVVGLMMCHVMGVKRPEALEHAAHLGLAMQLTNIARDVAEDWTRGRLYLPEELLLRHAVGGLHAQLGKPLSALALPGVAGAVGELLAIADGYYRSGAAGLPDLSPRCALAVDAARLIYADIGRALRRQGCDPLAGRAVVSTPRKLWLLVRAGLRALARLPRTWRAARHALIALSLLAAWHATGLRTHGQPEAPTPALGLVTVELLGVESSKGKMLAALFRDQRNFPGGGDKAFAKRVRKARAGSMRLTFENIPKGPYAVTVHHDEDGDFEMDTGLFGIPTEGYGFSRNAHAPFGPPSFDASKLVMSPGQQQHLRIRLRY